MKEFDLESLKNGNGLNGNPVYIAHGNRVIDVSASKLWKSGLHMRRHHAGTDLTADLQEAPHGIDVLDRYPQIGIIQSLNPPPQETSPGALERILEKVPFLRRHPHPMTVHFPIVFHISPIVFLILYYLTGISSFEVTAWHCLGAAVLCTPVAIVTGLFTWWLNYSAQPIRPVKIKMILSPLVWLIALSAFLLRLFTPMVASSGSPLGIFYILMVASLFPLVFVIGWYGATLTFPIEKGK
ncbi:MAG: hypothetical protein CSYNP_01420 [Syntrophus sp. SKADARSKE-3]|nr:hypothetical protein [Syntrophus sp. SKADARSKE-3]